MILQVELLKSNFFGTSIPTEKLQAALSNVGNYVIEDSNGSEMNHHHEMKETENANLSANGTGKFYCPMHCEGEKMYDNAGDCPVCGMHLVQEQTIVQKAQYTCPMHPEIIRDAPGSCPDLWDEFSSDDADR